jgi:hypothetical protein
MANGEPFTEDCGDILALKQFKRTNNFKKVIKVEA